MAHLGMHEIGIDGRERAAGTLPRAADLVLLAAFCVLVLHALLWPLDVAWTVSGDALYAVHMLDFGLLEYRPPMANRLLPDVLLNLAIAPLGLERAMAALLAGTILFGTTYLVASVTRGPLAAAMLLLILSASGFEVFDSINHFSLPLAVFAVIATRGTRYELPVLGIAAFSDPLVLVPLAFVLVTPAPLGRHLRAGATVLSALVLNTIYSEFSPALVALGLVLPAWMLAVWLAGLAGLRHWLCVATTAGLVVLALAALVPLRYGVPVAASMVFILFAPRSHALDWRAVTVPLVATALMFVSADWRRHDRLASDYACLTGELARRGITTVAAEHWTSKPLYFAAKDAGLPLTITQIDFASGNVHSLMAPYSFYGAPTPWAVRGDDTCSVIAPGSAMFCGQAETAPVAESIPVCGAFTLYRYAQDLPLAAEAPPAGKFASLTRNFNVYATKALGRLGLAPGS